MKSVRSLLIRFALFGTSLVLSLLAIEALLRVEVFKRTGVRSRPVVERARSKMELPDFRQPGFEIGDKQGAFRILVVGDSFAWGDGVYYEDAFPFRMETRLGAISRGDRFEVINWSRPGWNTLRQLRSLEPRLEDLDPDLVVLAFVLNDPEPVERSELEAMLSAAEGREPEKGLSSWLFRTSRLYGLIWTRLENSRTHRELSNFYHELFVGEHWEACRRALKRMRNLVRRRGTPMVLVVFPVFDGPMDESYPYADLHAQIREEGQSLQIPVLDLMRVYQGLDSRRLAVIPFSNAHPTEIAHRIAADEIIGFLVRRELIPPVRYKPRRRRR